jgi:hypothetical protein
MALELKAGNRVKVRDQYTLQIGGDLFQGGEIVPVTAKNVDELEQQRWKLESTSSGKKSKSEDDEDEDKDKIKEKQIKDKPIVNRAILDTKTTRTRVKME